MLHKVVFFSRLNFRKPPFPHSMILFIDYKSLNDDDDENVQVQRAKEIVNDSEESTPNKLH